MQFLDLPPDVVARCFEISQNVLIGSITCKLLQNVLRKSSDIKVNITINGDYPNIQTVKLFNHLEVGLKFLRLRDANFFDFQTFVADLSLVSSFDILGPGYMGPGIDPIDTFSEPTVEGPAQFLSDSIQILSSLVSLKIMHCKIPSDSLLDISRSFPPTLTALHISCAAIDAVAVRHLACSFCCLPQLRSLILSQNCIGWKGADHLAAIGFSNMQALQVLDLGGNQIKDRGAHAISKELKLLPCLQKMSLINNQISKNGAKAISRSFKHVKYLQSLDLSSNYFGCVGIKYISSQFASISYLTDLDLSARLIYDEDEDRFIYDEDQARPMGFGGAKALSKGLQHLVCLLKLSLEGNDLGNDGMMVIAQSLNSVSKLKYLDVSYNDIGIDGAKGLLQHLIYVPNLIELNFSSNSFHWSSISSKLLASNSFYWCCGEAVEETATYLKQEPNLIFLYLFARKWSNDIRTGILKLKNKINFFEKQIAKQSHTQGPRILKQISEYISENYRDLLKDSSSELFQGYNENKNKYFQLLLRCIGTKFLCSSSAVNPKFRPNFLTMMMTLEQIWDSPLEWYLQTDELQDLFRAVFRLDVGITLDGLSAADFEAIYDILSEKYAEWSEEDIGYNEILQRLVCSDSFPISRIKKVIRDNQILVNIRPGKWTSCTQFTVFEFDVLWNRGYREDGNGVFHFHIASNPGCPTYILKRACLCEINPRMSPYMLKMISNHPNVSLEGLVYSIVAGHYDFHNFDWDQNESSVLQSLSADTRLTNEIIQQMGNVVTRVINLRKSDRSIVLSGDSLSPFCRAINYPESMKMEAGIIFPIIQRDSEGSISCLLSWEQITARIITFMAFDAAAVNSESPFLYVEWERPYYWFENYRTFFRIYRENAGKIKVQQEEGLTIRVSIEKLLHMKQSLEYDEMGIFEEQGDDFRGISSFACFEMYDVDAGRREIWTQDVGLSLHHIKELVQRWLKEDVTDLNEWATVKF